MGRLVAGRRREGGHFVKGLGLHVGRLGQDVQPGDGTAQEVVAVQHGQVRVAAFGPRDGAPHRGGNLVHAID